jgi:hypothetical protein
LNGIEFYAQPQAKDSMRGQVIEKCRTKNGRPSMIGNDALNAVLDSADLVVVPYSRIITGDGHVCPVALASGKKFIIAGSHIELLQAEKEIRDKACLVGSIEGDLVVRDERSH